MELIIAMVIIGILTAIAIPNYTAYIQRSNRREARNQLLEMRPGWNGGGRERGRYDNPGNINNPPPSPPFPANWVQSPPLPATAKYTIVRRRRPPTTFTITATAVGVMAGDACSDAGRSTRRATHLHYRWGRNPRYLLESLTIICVSRGMASSPRDLLRLPSSPLSRSTAPLARFDCPAPRVFPIGRCCCRRLQTGETTLMSICLTLMTRASCATR